MGGFFRAVTRIFSKPPQVMQQPTPVAAAPVSQTQTTTSDKSSVEYKWGNIFPSEACSQIR